MTVANGVTSIADAQHLVLDDISWEFYEELLRELGNRQIRITFDQGRLEIMSPLPRHEMWSQWINRLIEVVCMERSIRVASLGSTTFKSSRRRKGLEPDKCYYIKHAEQGFELDGEFDADEHQCPDLAVEIDITSSSIPREPIYAALGVPELWRFDGEKFQVFNLSPKRKYVRKLRSKAFPFLPMAQFGKFVFRMRDKDQAKVLRELRDLVSRLPS